MAVLPDTELYWETEEYRKTYSQKERDEMAKNGQAMPDGSFPIKDGADLANAIRLVGNSNNPKADVIAHIKKRAKALGLNSELPEDWRSSSAPVARRKVRHRTRTAESQAFRSPEVRNFTTDRLEIRAADPAGEYVMVTGEPIVYNTPYQVVDMFGEFQERMLPGVASQVMAKGADVRFLLNHNGMPFARTTSGTMKLEDGETGLRFSANFSTHNQAAMDVVDAIERGDISQMSCGFIVAPGGDQWNENETERSISQFADLLDVSAVTYPASPTTSIQVAQRALMGAPVESFTRLEKIYVDLRAGKVLSQENQDKLVGAVKTLHEVLVAGGVNPQDIIDPDHDGDDDLGETGDTDADASESTQPDATTADAQDASGMRTERHPDSQDPEDVCRSTAHVLDLERELLELRRYRST